MGQDDDLRDMRDRIIRLEERFASMAETVKKLNGWIIGVAVLVLTAVGKSLLSLINLGG